MNKQSKSLYTSSEIHKCIKHLFGQPGRTDKRVALVAYVGVDGDKYLPHPDGLILICNPSPGGTDPNTLRRLIKNGANVRVSDSLHMKVYWSRSKGCVITSANASSNALGRGSLKESGVWLSNGTVDIQKLIRYAQPREITDRDFRLLDSGAKEFGKLTKGSEKRIRAAPSFNSWYASPHRSAFKLHWTEALAKGAPLSVKEETRTEYGHREPHTWASFSKNSIRKNEWILAFVLSERRITHIQWLYSDFVVKLTSKDKKYYDRKTPACAVQVNTLSKYPLPPFQLTPKFKEALNRALKRFTRPRMLAAKSNKPPAQLLSFIQQEYAP